MTIGSAERKQTLNIEQIDRHDPNTEVFSWGCDRNGQLGLGQEHGQKQT